MPGKSTCLFFRLSGFLSSKNHPPASYRRPFSLRHTSRTGDFSVRRIPRELPGGSLGIDCRIPYSDFLRYSAVIVAPCSTISLGVPVNTISPPALPPSGPTSISQSACFITSRLLHYAPASLSSLLFTRMKILSRHFFPKRNRTRRVCRSVSFVPLRRDCASSARKTIPLFF